jgi:hypothetical protein
MTSRKPTGGSFSVGVPRQGIAMFQTRRMFSNMLIGAIDVASNDSEIRTPCRRMRRSATRGSPATPNPKLGVGEKLSGVLVRAIAAASASLAGR